MVASTAVLPVDRAACIAHLRSWKVLATGCRRPLPKADRALQTVIKPQMYRHHSQAAVA